jgi:hypothetical protein
MNVKPTVAIAFSGFLWLIMGIFLLMKGLNLIVLAIHPEQFSVTSALIPFLARFAGKAESAALIIIAFGLVLGFVKGRFVLSKSVKRTVQRILLLPLPLKLQHVYSKGYVAIIASMMCLGMILRWSHLPADVHGLIDVAIGSALVNGGMIYFRFALFSKKSGA